MPRRLARRDRVLSGSGWPVVTGIGPLGLVGGGEWSDACRDFDADLLAASGGREVVVLPTAAAYEHPDRAVTTATRYFESLGASVRAAMVLNRRDAEADEHADVVRAARFVYLGGGSPLHLRSVLKESAVWNALAAAWQEGAVVAGSSAGAMVLGDPMIDPRGGAFTLGLGLVANLAVLPHLPEGDPAGSGPAGDQTVTDNLKRTLALAPSGTAVVGLPEQTALILTEGRWRAAGRSHPTIWLDGKRRDLDALPS